MKKRKQNIKSFHHQFQNILQQKYENTLFSKHCQLYLLNTESLINRSYCKETIEMYDIQMWIKKAEYMKRQYSLSEFSNKIDAITQYYKFQYNKPLIFDLPIYKIMKKHQCQADRVKRKEIKQFMKENHGVEISSVNTFSSSENSSHQVGKSKYSTKLSRINSNRTSLMLEGICDQINVALKNYHPPNYYKGKFDSREISFKKFIRKKSQKNHRKFSKQKKNEQNFESNQVFQKKYKTKSVNHIKKFYPKSFSKTTNNETISREEVGKGFRRRKIKKNDTRSLPKIVPENIKTDHKHHSHIHGHKTNFRNEPINTFQKSLNMLKKRITSGKNKRDNEDIQVISKMPSLNRISRSKNHLENEKNLGNINSKSRKLVKGFRPSSANLKNKNKQGVSPGKGYQRTLDVFPKANQTKNLDNLIRKKLQLR